MTIDIQALVNDMGQEDNIQLASEYVPYILNELMSGPKTLDQLYQGDYYDIPLYIALYNLCKVGLVIGPNPYSDDSPHDHRLMKYGRAF